MDDLGFLRGFESQPRAVGGEEEDRALFEGVELDEVLPLLTDREREVVELIMDGYTRADIEQMMGISQQGVRGYIDRISAKITSYALSQNHGTDF